MIRRALAVLLLLSTSALAAPRRRAVHPSPFDAVAAIATQALANGVPGVSIAIMRGDELLYSRGFGFVDVQSATPASAESVYQIGSITKQFTAAAIMKLVEAGKIQTSDGIRTYVSELSSQFDPITLDHLLRHTSGVQEYNSLLTSAYEPKSESEMIALIGSRPPSFVAGAAWSYSNSNYYLLGIVIERVSGESYAQFINDNFILPLGLTRTSYCGTDPAFPVPEGYFRDNGAVAPIAAADMSLVFAAGALCSSAPDLARWNNALVNGRAVSSQSYARMTTLTRLNSGRQVFYGYGLVIDTLDGHPRVWHNGAILGFEGQLAWYSEDDLTIGVLVNVIDLHHDIASEISDAIARELLR